MKTLTKIALLIVALSAAASAEAQMVRGYFRSNGTYVAPYYRTPANSIPFDNLSYRGYPSQQPGYVSPRIRAYGPEFTPLPNNFGFSQPSFRSPSVELAVLRLS
jgi:hypothetical protein